MAKKTKRTYLKIDVTRLSAENRAELRRIVDEYMASHVITVAPADEPSPTCTDC